MKGLSGPTTGTQNFYILPSVFPSYTPKIFIPIVNKQCWFCNLLTCLTPEYRWEDRWHSRLRSARDPEPVCPSSALCVGLSQNRRSAPALYFSTSASQYKARTLCPSNCVIHLCFPFWSLLEHLVWKAFLWGFQWTEAMALYLSL